MPRLTFQLLGDDVGHRRDHIEGPRRGLRVAEPPLAEDRHTERPDRFRQRIGRERHAPEVGVEVEGLVDAEVQVLARGEALAEERVEIEPRRIDEIGRVGLVVGRIDVLQPPRQGDLVEIGAPRSPPG